MPISQSSDIAEYLGLTAGVLSPWRANQYSVDPVSTSIHVWVTSQAAPQPEQKRTWFGARTVRVVAASPAGEVDQCWRHLDCIEYTCFVHTCDPLDASDRELPWFGQADMPFSNRLARQVFLLLMEGVDMQVICDALKLSFADLWKFKYALDNGLLHFEYAPAAHRKPRSAFISAPPGTATTPTMDSVVPDMFDPVWEKLITGTLHIQIKTLSFQLLLTKLRQQVNLQQSADVKLMKLRELHRYVERHERVLGHELSQLNQCQ